MLLKLYGPGGHKAHLVGRCRCHSGAYCPPVFTGALFSEEGGPSGCQDYFFAGWAQLAAGAALFAPCVRVEWLHHGSEQAGLPMASTRINPILIPRGFFAACPFPAAVIGIGGGLIVSCDGVLEATVGVTQLCGCGPLRLR